MTHLGRWLSALVDGELDGVERDHVLNHVAGCDSCRKEANAMRALKRRLTALGDASAGPAIASRLIELARCDEAVPAGALPLAVPTGIAHARRTTDWGCGLLARTWRLAAASAGASLITIGVLAFLIGNGETQPPVPKVTPSVDSYLMQHAFDAGQARAGSTPAAGNSPATPGAGQGLAAGHAGPGRPASGKSGHSLARPTRHRTTRASGTAAAKPGSRAAASPTASPDVSPSPSGLAGVSAGPPVTGRNRG
jgi:putative zinc finger protein